MWCSNHPKEDLAKLWLLAEEENRENLGVFSKIKVHVFILLFFIS
jgi:hypothetical protein